jgi:protein-arginine kinase activator protein McsA
MASQLVIICTKCKESKGTTKVRYDKLAKEGRIKNYVCKSCKGKTKVKKTGNSQLTIECTKCGQHKATTPVRYQKLLKEDRITNYICRDCKPKKNVTKIKVSKDTGEVTENITLGLSPWMQNRTPHSPRQPYTNMELGAIGTCFRPDIWVENKKLNRGEGACNGCPLYATCGCNTKVLSTRLEKLERPKKK